MNVEQYKRQVTPEVRQGSYRVEPMDLSGGLAVSREADRTLSKGMDNLGESVEKILAIQQKVQNEKDELFGNAAFHEFDAEMQAFQPTLDQEKDDEVLHGINQKYADRISNEKSISEESRKRMLQLLDNRFSVGKIRVGGARNRMAAKMNLEQTEKYFEEAKASGNVDAALGYAAELRGKGVGTASDAAITSLCRKNGYRTNIPQLTYESLDTLETEINHELSFGRGFDGMSERDSIEMRNEIGKQKRKVEADSMYAYLAGICQGEIPSLEQLDNDYKNGMMSDRQYQQLHGAASKILNLSKTQSDKAKEKNRQEQKNKYLAELRMTTEFPEDLTERKEWVNAKLKGAMEISIEDSFLSSVRSRCEEIFKEDTGYKKSTSYLLGMNMLESMKKEFTSYAAAAERSWYTLGIKHAPEAGKEVTKTNYEMMKDKLSLWLKNNPDATEKDIRVYLDESKAFINAQQVADLMSAWAEIPTGRRLSAGNRGGADKPAGKPETTPDKKQRRKTRDGRTVEWDGKGWRVIQ